MIHPLAHPPVGPPLAGSHDEPEALSRSGPARMAGALEEIEGFAGDLDFRRAAWSAARFLPAFALPRLRARLLAMVGCDLGEGVAVGGYVHLIGPRDCARRLRIGRGCIVGPEVTFCLDAPVVLGNNVSVGPRATLYTATHPLGTEARRMRFEVMARPIAVEDGCWIGLGATILAGVRIGRGAVVGAGAVVNQDVPANVLVAGNPATIVESLPSG